MQAAIEQFRENIQRVRSLGAIYQAFESQTTPVLDLSDLLRSQLVMSVSSLDLYVHELVRLGMLEAYHKNRIQTDLFLRFQVAMINTLQALQTISIPGNDAWLDAQIRARHGYQSFQNPDNIADAVRLISDVQLWNAVATQLGASSQDVRGQLSNIVNRRNQIAHEADINPSYPGSLWPISYNMVDSSITFIDNLAEAIHSVVA